MYEERNNFIEITYNFDALIFLQLEILFQEISYTEKNTILMYYYFNVPTKCKFFIFCCYIKIS